MNLKIGKKAVANIIVVVLLILIVISMVSILSVVVMKMVREPLMAPTNCLDYQIKTPISISKISYDSSEKRLQITLKRMDDDFDIRSLDFIIKDKSGSSSWCCGEECEECVILEKGTQEYYFPNIEDPSEVSLIVEECFVESSSGIKEF